MGDKPRAADDRSSLLRHADELQRPRPGRARIDVPNWADTNMTVQPPGTSGPSGRGPGGVSMTRNREGRTRMPKIVHFEIPADDPQRASAFCHDALGWEISRFGDEPYWLVRAGEDGEPGANGALVARGELHRGPVLIAGVEDIDDVLGRVESCGGMVVLGKLPVPGVGWSGYVLDPEGNTIGLFQPDASAAAGRA